MGRPREFSVDAAVAAAKETFWRRGYEGTTLTDLEAATGLSRSSLYHAFGSKEALFAQALASYIDTFIDPLLRRMEHPRAGLREIQSFFRRLRALFRQDPALARRGCLWVNTIEEVSGRQHPADARATDYTSRLRVAFANSLSHSSAGSARRPAVVQRSRVLVAMTFGIWVAVRVDADDAIRMCDSVLAEVRSWEL